jgi:hypothetical protein
MAEMVELGVLDILLLVALETVLEIMDDELLLGLELFDELETLVVQGTELIT